MKKHIWGKVNTYLFLIGACIGIILIEILVITILEKMGKGECINDNITEGILFLICIPGIVVGIIGAIICAVRKK